MFRSALGPLWDELLDLGQPAVLPLRALLVGVAGVLLALSPSSDGAGARAGFLAVCVVVSVALARLGQALLHRWPRTGLALMEIWILAPLAIAVLASALAARVTVELSVAEDATVTEKVRLTALATGVNAFLSAAFIAWVSDRDESRLARRARRAFQAKYVRVEPGERQQPRTKRVQAGSTQERLVYSEDVAGISGWSFEARWRRAGGLIRAAQT